MCPCELVPKEKGKKNEKDSRGMVRCVGGWERRTKEAEKRDEEQCSASNDLIGWVAVVKK